MTIDLKTRHDFRATIVPSLSIYNDIKAKIWARNEAREIPYKNQGN